MAVFIDGVEYMPKTDEFRLTEHHFDAAATQSDSFGLIRWARETQASVDEMLAWGRARRGEDLIAPITEQPKERKKVEPLKFPDAKPKGLFK